MYLGADTASVAGTKKNNWAQAKAAGISFGIPRAAYGDWEDPVFDANWAGMAKAGVVRCAYLFLRAPRTVKKSKVAAPVLTEELPVLQRPPSNLRYAGATKVPDPVKQVDAFCKIVGKLNPNDFPPALDVEFPGRGRLDTGLSAQQLLDWVLAAWKALRDFYGVAPVIYTSARVMLDDLLNLPVPKEVLASLLWLARYYVKSGPVYLHADQLIDPEVPAAWAGDDPKTRLWRGVPYTTDNWAMHQYQGNATGAPGFSTNVVDMNRMRPMKQGDHGEDVKWVQERLPGYTGEIDGDFGPKTDKALRQFQKVLPDTVPDGILKPRERAYLCWQQ